MQNKADQEFIESQQFNQWWLWALLLAIFSVGFYGLIQQLILDIPFGSKPMNNIGILGFNFFNLGMLLFFKWMRLDTRIDDKGIYMRFVPFKTKQHSWEEIESIQVVHYGFVGGWGIRLFTEYGTVYNMRGAKGLAIRLKSGKKFLIGSQRIEELTKYIAQFPQNKA
ncbi:MAG TPA: hypothetical protein DCZ44_03125 [Flavobacteriaceae bacterium]|nr:hypothetical protein [Flavobacteriaceae bacterium]